MADFAPGMVLMDFYGTLVAEDDVPIGQVCSQVAAASQMTVTAKEIGSYWGQVYHQLCRESHGATFRLQRDLELHSLERVLGHFRADLDGDALSQALYEYWMHPDLYPESLEVLARCPLPICLVSNIDNADLQSALEHNSLHFERIVTSEDCRAYKPRGEMYARALALLGLSPDSALHVGDSLSSDVAGARRMGIPALWIDRKGRRRPDHDHAPDYRASNLYGLLDILGA